MAVYNSLHPRADVDRLYVLRKEGDRELVNIQDIVNMEEQSPSRYIDAGEEELEKASDCCVDHSTTAGGTDEVTR